MGMNANLLPGDPMGPADRLSMLATQIKKGLLVPIISNSVVNDPVFDIGAERGLGIFAGRAGDPVDRECEDYSLRIDQLLAGAWAKWVDYPLAEEPLLLSRVAQFLQARGSRSLAKEQYLYFLKYHLLNLAQKDPDAAEAAWQQWEHFLNPETNERLETDQLFEVSRTKSFSEIVYQLNYLDAGYEYEQQKRLEMLAKLPLPMFVTTSHHDFLERALTENEDMNLRIPRKNLRIPRTLVCDWFGDSTPLQHEIEWFGDPPDPEEDKYSDATVLRPVVCHLYGLESYPETLVVSEDDYMQFLVKVSENEKENIPLWLRVALGKAGSAMLLLGYTLRSWEFRVLFQGLIQPYVRHRRREETDSNKAHPNLAVQLNPPPCRKRSEDKKDKEDEQEEETRHEEDEEEEVDEQEALRKTLEYFQQRGLLDELLHEIELRREEEKEEEEPRQEEDEEAKRKKDEEAKQKALDNAQQYLAQYLGSSNFEVEWQNTTDFLQGLLTRWNRSRR